MLPCKECIPAAVIIEGSGCICFMKKKSLKKKSNIYCDVGELVHVSICIAAVRRGAMY